MVMLCSTHLYVIPRNKKCDCIYSSMINAFIKIGYYSIYNPFTNIHDHIFLLYMYCACFSLACWFSKVTNSQIAKSLKSRSSNKSIKFMLYWLKIYSLFFVADGQWSVSSHRSQWVWGPKSESWNSGWGSLGCIKQPVWSSKLPHISLLSLTRTYGTCTTQTSTLLWMVDRKYIYNK